MKTKLLTMLLSSVVAVSFGLPFSVSAASPMKATAKAGDAVVDGVISEGEYADPFVLNGDNGATWANLGPITSPITYRFAWSEKGLYIAFSYAEAIEGSSQLQINCNPGGQLGAADQGLFITLNPAGNVLIHNHNTPLGNIDPNTLSLDITTKVTMASKTTDGTKVTEVLVPMDAFRVKDTSFKFSAGDMACSAFAVLMANGAPAEVGAAVSSDLSDWTVGKLGLGTLTLAAAEEKPDEKPDEKPEEKPGETPETGDSDWMVLAVCIAVLATGVIVAVSRKTSKAAK